MGRRASSSELTNSVHAYRIELGLSQQQLAERAGLTRQAVNAIEANRYTPNTVVSLRLARALECRVENLFRVADAPSSAGPTANGDDLRIGDRAVLGRVGDRLVSHALSGERAMVEGFATADGVMREGADVQLFVPRDELERTAFLVGCDPSLGMVANWVTRRARDARLVWIPGSSREALDALRNSTAHIAGIHLRDACSGECNLAQAKRALGDGGVVVGYADWEQGFVVERGNPKGLESVEAFVKRGVRLVNRENGSGSRSLFDQLLRAADLPPDRITGYSDIVRSHMAVAREVGAGRADAGIGLRAVAETLDLGFVPLADVKFDLLIPRQHLSHPAVEVLLDVLQTSTLRAGLAALPGYDSSQTGDVRGRFDAVAWCPSNIVLKRRKRKRSDCRT